MDALGVFISYAHADERFRRELEKHLAGLKSRGLVRTWHDRMIPAGVPWADQIDARLDSASIILLLITADFLASDYCYGVEMRRALERHMRDEARVIPVFIKPAAWNGQPFAHLQGVPRDGKAVTKWSNRDEAYVCVAEELEAVIQDIRRRQGVATSVTVEGTGPEVMGGSPDALAKVATGTAAMDIEITINADYNEFTPEDKRRVLEAIGRLLETKHELKVTRMRPGSVKLTLRLSPEEAERLRWEIERGALENVGVVAAEILGEVGSEGDDLSPEQVEHLLWMTSQPGGLEDKETEEEQVRPMSGAMVDPPYIPGYELLRSLGNGSFGAVHVARQLAFDRVVALKVVSTHMISDRMIQFYQSLISITSDHHNILKVYEFQIIGDRFYLAMEYIEGGSLRSRMKREVPMSVEDVRAIVGPVCEAINLAHGEGILHGDLRPENILMDGAVPKVADFGLDPRIHGYVGPKVPGQREDMLGYVAPEHEYGGWSPRADQYAMAVIAYEMVTGVKYLGSSRTSLPSYHNPRVDRHADAVIMRGLMKNPADRYPSIGEFGRQLDASLSRLWHRRSDRNQTVFLMVVSGLLAAVLLSKLLLSMLGR